jgi:protein-disulfide isomerase
VPPPSDDAATKGDNKTAGAATAATAAAEGDAESCSVLAEKICTETGDGSPTCNSAKTITGVLAPAACAANLANMDFTMSKLAEVGNACKELTDKLCAEIGTETQTCKQITGQIGKMPPAKCESMSEGAEYAKVLSQVKSMEARNKPLSAEAAAKIAAAGEGIPTFGSADSKVQLVEFSDFQCPYCSKAADAVNEVKKSYGDKVHFVFRQFPLGMHKDAHLAAQASLAAHAQGKFWEYHDKLFANQRALGREQLESYAEELGLDMAAFKKALDEGTYKDAVDGELALGQEVHVSGTPTMFLNGKRVGNATDAKAISAEIDKVLGG